MERLAEIDTVVFDKTGVLTLGGLRLANVATIAPRRSRPCVRDRRSLAASARPRAGRRWPGHRTADFAFDDISEHAGLGVEAVSCGTVYRLGRAEWALGEGVLSGRTGTVLSRNGRLIEAFRFDDPMRPGAQATIEAADALGPRRRDRLRRPASAGAAACFRAWRADLRSRSSARRQGGAGRRACGVGAQGADGGRWPERRAGARRRPCLDGASDRRRRRPQRRRFRVPSREPGGGAAGDRGGAGSQAN